MSSGNPHASLAWQARLHGSRSIQLPSHLNIALILALFVPYNLLFVPMFFLVLHTAKNGAQGVAYLALGLALTCHYLLLGTGDIRALLPFVILFGLTNPSRSESTLAEANRTFLIFAFLTLGVAALKIFGYSHLDGILSFYDDGAGEAFDYDIEDLGHFRVGSIYFNPNQWAFLTCLFVIFLNARNQLTPLKIILVFMIMLATASRMMVLIVLTTLLVLQLRNWSVKKALIGAFIFLAFLYYVVSTESRLATYSWDALLYQAFYKFSLLQKLLEQDSILEFALGSGTVGKGYFHFDADLGNLLKAYGLLGGSLVVALYYVKLARLLPLFPILLLSMMSAYGTVLTNTRIAMVFATLAMMCCTSGVGTASSSGALRER